MTSVTAGGKINVRLHFAWGGEQAAGGRSRRLIDAVLIMPRCWERGGPMLRILAALIAVLLLTTTSDAQRTTGSTGKPPAHTTVLAEKDGAPSYVFGLRVFLPKAVADRAARNNGDVGPGLVLDERYAAFYRYTTKDRGIEIIIDGTRDPNRSAEACANVHSEEVIYGTNEPRERASASSQEADTPWRQFTFAFGCDRYSIKIQCSRDTDTTQCRKALNDLQKLKDWRGMLSAASLIYYPRYPRPQTRPPVQRQTAAEGELPQPSSFSYIEPGIFRGRQYLAPPPECAEVAKAQSFYADGRTAYSRIVFAGPAVMKRFPIDLSASSKALANSQIFGPGGHFILNRRNNTRFLPQGDLHGQPDMPPFAHLIGSYQKSECKNKAVQVEHKDGKPLLGLPGQYGADFNFDYPWSDTFCEFRENGDYFFFCGTNGRPMRGVHYGNDVRGPAQSLENRTPVIAVADGKIFKVDEGCRAIKFDEKAKKCLVGTDLPFWDVGHTVRLKSSEDPNVVFVYRHMNLNGHLSATSTEGRSKKVIRFEPEK